MKPTCRLLRRGYGTASAVALLCGSALSQTADSSTPTAEVPTLENLRASDPLNALGLNIYGFVQLDAFGNTERLDPAWVDVMRPSSIPTSNNAGAYGAGGEFGMSVRTSQFGAKGQYEAGSHTLKTWFEFDLLETGTKAGETGLHLRHAWGEWGRLGAGQTHSTFMDIGMFPNSHQYWGPPGMVFNRNPQIRYTIPFESSSFAIALEQQNAGLDAGVLVEIDPTLGANVQAKSDAPDLIARYKQRIDRGYWQLAGVLRSLAYETKGTPGNDPSGKELGWGLSASAGFRTSGRNMLKLQVTTGAGIASFMNDGGSNLAPHDGTGDAVPLTAMSAYYDHYWNDTWSTSVGYSFNDIDSRSGQLDSAFSKGEYATGNIMHVPNEHISYSFETYWAERTDKNGATGDSFRFQVSIKWDFSLGAFAPSFDT
ncbi:MAG: porin [Planctomycetes bacterium]|nr:porin [Planctomycetota bacterium]MCB9903944.1 porin [Planctomycetota bacterium]